MKIALFSDIHANFAAFEQMLADMDGQKPDAVYCLGDLVGYHIYPNEVIDEIRRRKIPTLKGNHDEKVQGISTSHKNLNEPGKQHAYHLITEDNRKYLATLPAYIKLDFNLPSGNVNALFAHGSAKSIDEYVLVDTDEQYVLAMMEKANTDLLFVGHSHKPYHRIIATDNGFKHVINLGSVGKPKDGDPRACYVILVFDENASILKPESIKIEFRRVEYDVAASAKAIEESLLPDEFAVALRLAK